MAKRKPATPKTVEAFRHDGDKRRNIPTAELQSVVDKTTQSPVRVAYERRNRDLDPQLVWRGKDDQDAADLLVAAPPIYIQEKVHPKVLIDDLRRRTEEGKKGKPGQQLNLFADFNGIPHGVDKTEFYEHDQNWSNRMILGDSLQVMASLSERESLRGKVQCIYFDPPYGIKFNSNFQWSTTSRDVKDGKMEHITREPEQVKAFRDTWRDGIHSYLTYLRDRLTVARDLLADSGSIFVQIGDDNVHRVRAVMDEVFGDDNCISVIAVSKTMGATSAYIPNTIDFIVWYAKNTDSCKYKHLFIPKKLGEPGTDKYSHIESDTGIIRNIAKEEKQGLLELLANQKTFLYEDITSQTGGDSIRYPYQHNGRIYTPSKSRGWRTNIEGMHVIAKANRLLAHDNVMMFKRYLEDFAANYLTNSWTDTSSGSSTLDPKIYVVQTRTNIVQRCVLMVTDPGDLVLDPTCGSGTTAYVAEQWGRRWITIDTSRVALALARSRIMGARYPYYLLADSRDGQMKEAEVSRNTVASQPTHGDLRLGFVYERVPHITLKSIANNAEIDVIWDNWQKTLQPLREQLNKALKKKWEEWEIPREADSTWPDAARKAHAKWWEARIARQKEIDASIAAKADFEFLYDKPYVDNRKVRVAGPFTVESLSPHRVMEVDENGQFVDPLERPSAVGSGAASFVGMILDNLRTAGVQQARKEGKIDFSSLTPWPGRLVCAEGRYMEGAAERRAAIFIGPEFGTVQRQELVEATREAGDADFDILIACGFSFDAMSSEFDKLGRIRILKARMNADLHMSAELKNTGKGNLFVVFGEPDIDLLKDADDRYRVKVNGVDVFHPTTGEIVSNEPDDIACWFVDTDYNGESFFVRHAYFLGAGDPYKSLKTSLKAEIDEDAWATLYGDTSRPFDKPTSGRIAVKVINHLGDEVMKVYKWTFGENRANHRPISSKDVTAYGPMG
jgi:adenine-specific DNA-methyltransferase